MLPYLTPLSLWVWDLQHTFYWSRKDAMSKCQQVLMVSNVNVTSSMNLLWLWYETTLKHLMCIKMQCTRIFFAFIISFHELFNKFFNSKLHLILQITVLTQSDSWPYMFARSLMTSIVPWCLEGPYRQVFKLYWISLPVKSKILIVCSTAISA